MLRTSTVPSSSTTLTGPTKPVRSVNLPREFGELPSVTPRRTPRLTAWARRHRRTIAWLAPILVATGIVNGINLGGDPAQVEGEGTITAQAWAILNLGHLAPYSYTFDHPPLGWIQIAAWAGLTNAFGRDATAIIAGREAMLVALLASTAVLWFLARRIGLSRGATAVATVFFALSPLAITLHRSVLLENVATPWLLASVLLAMTKRRQLLGFAAAAACLGVAGLSSETSLLGLPLIAWLMWRNAHPETRRYTASVAASVFVLFGFSYALFAVLKGEFLPSGQHPSLIAGIESQFGSPAAPASYAVMLLPVVALAIAGSGDWAVKTWRARTTVPRVPIIAIAVLTAGAVVVAIPTWGPQLRSLLTADSSRTSAQAEQWVQRYVSTDSRLIVDDSMWVDFVQHGFDPDNVIWFTKLDTDAVVKAQNPQGWKDSDYVISTATMRTSPGAPSTGKAISNSVVVASFGSGSHLIQVRRIETAGPTKTKAAQRAAESERASTGQAVAQNPNLSASPEIRTQLDAGLVDPRISLALGQFLTSGTVTVTALPTIFGEHGSPLREVDIQSVAGNALVKHGSLTAEGRVIVGSLTGRYAPQYYSVTSSALRLTFSIVPPADLIQ